MYKRIISYKTYCEFAGKYKIPVTKLIVVNNKTVRVRKTFKELQQDISDYEKNHKEINNGLYNN